MSGAKTVRSAQLKRVGFQNSAAAAELRFRLRAFVFVEQATQDRSALDPSVGEVRGGVIRAGRDKPR